MKTEMILKSSFLDILFEHRNKNYGAYLLRKTYKQRLVKALCMTIALTSLLFLVLTSFKNKNTIVVNPTIKDPIEVPKQIQDKPENKPKDEQKQKISEKVKLKISDTKPLLVNDTTPPKFNNDALGSIHGNSTDTGAADNGIVHGPENKDTGTAEVKVIPPFIPEVEDTKAHTDDVDEDATYVGGKNALALYLQDKLGDEALEDDEPKKITVQFIIEKDGTITNIKAINNEDADFLRKTEKAFAKMKSWKPAKIKSKAVRSYHSIPVTISLPE
jgi:periplasmic protein TonB